MHGLQWSYTRKRATRMSQNVDRPETVYIVTGFQPRRVHRFHRESTLPTVHPMLRSKQIRRELRS